MAELFDTNPAPPRQIPLAERLRPRALSEVVGQPAALGPEGPIGRMVGGGRLASMILWGPAGCGKTTIARLLAADAGLPYRALSAIFSGVGELRTVFDAAARRRDETGESTLLFVDEIHRFNKAQQDAFLPHVESGLIRLVGATTENPSFELNAPLLSRCQVVVLERLEAEALEILLQRAEAELGPLPLTAEARAALIAMADGDGRFLLSLAEEIAGGTGAPLDVSALTRAVQRRAPLYDKGEEGHYNLISALHKAVRGSDADAALYWLARMLDGGEDPHFIARRVLRMAHEDIGLADPQAGRLALDAWASYERLGSPEGELALAEAVIYMATAPKSNAVYAAYKAAMRAARESGSLAPPVHSLNAPTRLMRELGYGAGYEYDHDSPEAFAGQDYFPEAMGRRRFYRPTERGFERDIGRRLAWWERRRAARAAGNGAEGTGADDSDQEEGA